MNSLLSLQSINNRINFISTITSIPLINGDFSNPNLVVNTPTGVSSVSGWTLVVNNSNFGLILYRPGTSPNVPGAPLAYSSSHPQYLFFQAHLSGASGSLSQTVSGLPSGGFHFVFSLVAAARLSPYFDHSQTFTLSASGAVINNTSATFDFVENQNWTVCYVDVFPDNTGGNITLSISTDYTGTSTDTSYCITNCLLTKVLPIINGDFMNPPLSNGGNSAIASLIPSNSPYTSTTILPGWLVNATIPNGTIYLGLINNDPTYVNEYSVSYPQSFYITHANNSGTTNITQSINISAVGTYIFSVAITPWTGNYNTSQTISLTFAGQTLTPTSFVVGSSWQILSITATISTIGTYQISIISSNNNSSIALTGVFLTDTFITKI